eukprot:1188761-Prorocentrum_minimum.AAC.6
MGPMLREGGYGLAAAWRNKPVRRSLWQPQHPNPPPPQQSRGEPTPVPRSLYYYSRRFRFISVLAERNKGHNPSERCERARLLSFDDDASG